MKKTNDLKDVLWPIMKRVPTYMRLGVRLARDPAIPMRHKTILYGTVVYQLTPVHFLVSPIPVLGQIDGLILLLLSLQQMIRNCPPATLRRHMSRLRLEEDQIAADLEAVQGIGRAGMQKAGTHARFVGRVATGVARRTVARMMGVHPSSKAKRKIRPAPRPESA